MGKRKIEPQKREKPENREWDKEKAMYMMRQYTGQNVYDALQERFKLLFEEFDNIFVSFSGGKDSGILLNLALDFQQKYYPQKKIGVFHQDFEAQYTATTEYVEATFERVKELVEPYWVCLPMAVRTALSSYQMFWYPWDDTKEEAWCRPMPQHPYVINLGNNPITTYRYRMHQEDLARQFGRWYRLAHGGKKTVCLLGIRADESLQRYSGVLNKKHGYDGECWISKQFKDVWAASPLYDWSYADVWHAYAKFGYPYNRLYDMYYMAGLKPDQMRVASPFNDYAKDSLHLYRVLDPEMWVRLIGRVKGANFGAADPARGTHLGILHQVSAGYAAPQAEKKLYREIQNLHSVLAQNRRRAGGTGHSGADREGLSYQAKRRVELHGYEKFPGDLPR